MLPVCGAAPLALHPDLERIFMKYARAEHLLRWFLLLWLGLMYLWGLQLMRLSVGGSQIVVGVFPGVRTGPVPTQLPTQVSGFCLSLSPSLFDILLFSGLMVCHAGLYWLGLSGKLPRHWRFLYLAAQGLLVVMISFSLSPGGCVALAPPEEFLICLYLALIVGAISILDCANAIIAVVTGYLLLLVLNTVVLESRASLLVSVQTSLQASAQFSIWYAAMILFVVGYIIVYLQQLHVHSQLQVTHARLKASAAKIEALTRAYERQRLARELHDTLAQGLAGVVMQLEAANTHLAHRRVSTAQGIVQQAILCAREALVDARSAIDDLRARTTGAPDLTLAVREEIDRFIMATGISCNANILENLSVSPTLHEHVLGIVREGFTNITRHARARHVWVSFVPRGETLILEIRDDGVGFDPAAAGSGHYGLIGMRERGRLLGGYLNIRSAPGMGTSLQLCLLARQGEQGTRGPDPERYEKETERENLHA